MGWSSKKERGEENMKHFKGNFKLIISLIITAIIIVTVVAINIKETNTYAADFTDGSVTYTYTASSNKLAIAGSGAVTNKWKTNDNLKNYVTTITQITIAKTITSIEDSAFEGCTSLQTVAFNASSTCTNIGNNAFKGCTSLTNIKDGSTNNQIPASVTTIGQSAFANCTSLQSIMLKNAKTIGIEAFNNCSPTLSLAMTSTQEIDYTIPQGGIYKIEAHGGTGEKVTIEDEVESQRTGTGAKGGKSTGYIQLKQNDKLSTQLYAGGAGGKGSRNGITVKGSNGGKGIGVILNENTTPLLASGGGSGAGGQGICEERGEFHGEWCSRTDFESASEYKLTTGMEGVKFKYYCSETDCSSTNRLIATGRRRRRISSGR